MGSEDVGGGFGGGVVVAIFGELVRREVPGLGRYMVRAAAPPPACC